LNDEKDFIKLRCTNKENEVYHIKDWLCCFGSFDLEIEDDCNINYDSWSELGSTYEKPPDNDKYALAGSFEFKVIEIEVFKIID
jgi:hypothetical protein